VLGPGRNLVLSHDGVIKFYKPDGGQWSPVLSVVSAKSPSIAVMQPPEMEDIYDEGSVDPVYQAKSRVLNRALQEIGMGKYQVRILMLAFSLERHDRVNLVGFICRRRFRMVFVSDRDINFLFSRDLRRVLSCDSVTAFGLYDSYLSIPYTL
jgi:hypothetical protein